MPVLQDLVSHSHYLMHMSLYINIERKNEIPFETTPCVCAQGQVLSTASNQKVFDVYEITEP